jgi:DNA-binding NarL/FixJ family response regulator
MNQQIRILIVDDQRPTRQGLKALLLHYPQVEVVGEAANGQEALQLVAAYRPDVVLMDMQMPVMDGVEATWRIKGNWPQIKVVALAMYSTYEIEALKAGVDVFLVKGFPSDALLDAILNLNHISSKER